MGIDCAELPAPLRVVEERAVIESIVIRAVRLRVHGWRYHGHLVPVDGVTAIEMLNLLNSAVSY